MSMRQSSILLPVNLDYQPTGLQDFVTEAAILEWAGEVPFQLRPARSLQAREAEPPYSVNYRMPALALQFLLISLPTPQ
jgi:hypothetical protein